MTKPKPEFDPHSADTVLHYVGPGISGDVPADDLSANQLARIAWIRGGQKQETPADVSQSAISTIRDELIATGNYSTRAPSEPTKPTGVTQ